MLVQRLTQRLATLLSQLAARLRAAMAALRSAGHGATLGTNPREGHLSTQQSGSWLDDAHRLRQRRSTALATADQNRGQQVASGEPRPATPTRPIVPSPSPSPSASTPPPEPRPARPWQFPAHPAPTPATPATPPQPAAAARPSRELDEAQARRRLMSLKYLVRIGLYNEGFAPSAVPDQYRRSLGTDDELGDERQ